jgi:hypothetical protein
MKAVAPWDNRRKADRIPVEDRIHRRKAVEDQRSVGLVNRRHVREEAVLGEK